MLSQLEQMNAGHKLEGIKGATMRISDKNNERKVSVRAANGDVIQLGAAMKSFTMQDKINFDSLNDAINFQMESEIDFNEDYWLAEVNDLARSYENQQDYAGYDNNPNY